jgi:pimeloyl-ACP methyl ester carboxylesterase
MRRLPALLSYGTVLVAAWRWTYSTGGFLATGPALALLLDRYAWRVLPWGTVAWKREAVVRGGSFLTGAAGFYLMRPGIVPLWEAAYRGLVVCLLVFAAELLAGLVRRRSRVLVRGLLVVGFVGLVPVIGSLHPLHTVPKRTPAALGLVFEDVRFRTADGLELAAWLVPHCDARGNVIFCHGHGRNRGHVAALLPALHDMGLNVLAFDFRGHGDSPGHTSTFGHREVEDLCAAEAYLSRRFPGKPVFLVGISLGAAVSLQALPRLPHVRGVWSEGAFARLSNAVEHEFLWLPGFLREPLVRSYYVIGWLDCGLWGPAVNPVDCLRGLTVPVFFCHGVEDELVPFAEGRMLYEAYAGPKECWRVAGASHYNVRQRNTEEYVRRLRGFLEGCLTRGDHLPSRSVGVEATRPGGRSP